MCRIGRNPDWVNQYKPSVSTSLHNGLLSILIAFSITFLTPNVHLKNCFKNSFFYKVTGWLYCSSLYICFIFNGQLATYISLSISSLILQKFIYLIYTLFNPPFWCVYYYFITHKKQGQSNGGPKKGRNSA